MLDDPSSVGSRQYTRVLALADGLPIKVGNDVAARSASPAHPAKATSARRRASIRSPIN